MDPELKNKKNWGQRMNKQKTRGDVMQKAENDLSNENKKVI